MNILQLVSSSRTSGAEKHVAVLSDRLRKRGHNRIRGVSARLVLPDQLRTAQIPTLELDFRGIRSFAAPRSLVRYARENKIDLIHAHLTRATYFGLIAGRLANLPMVSPRADYVALRGTDVAYRYLFPQEPSHIVSVSDFIRNGLVRKGVAENRIRTIYNGTEFLTDELEHNAIPRDATMAKADLRLAGRAGLPPDAELIGLSRV